MNSYSLTMMYMKANKTMAPAAIYHTPSIKVETKDTHKPKAMIPKPSQRNLSKTIFIISNSSDGESLLFLLIGSLLVIDFKELTSITLLSISSGLDLRAIRRDLIEDIDRHLTLVDRRACCSV